MAKDPAFLLYTSLFLSGVSDLTMEERGQYITLLCLQHQKGELTPKNIKLTIQNVSVDVMSKFKELDSGNFVNEKLIQIVNERTAHAKHQKFKAYLTNSIIKIKKLLPNSNPNDFKALIHSESINYSEFSNDNFKEYFDKRYQEFANAQRTPLKDTDTNKDIIIEENKDGKPKPKKKPKKQYHLFIDSEYIDFDKFQTKIHEDEKYQCFDCMYYYESIKLWSESDNKKTNWIATAKSWMIRDLKEEKAKLTQDAEKHLNNNSRQSAYEKINAMHNK